MRSVCLRKSENRITHFLHIENRQMGSVCLRMVIIYKTELRTGCESKIERDEGGIFANVSKQYYAQTASQKWTEMRTVCLSKIRL